eukprot:SAG31_NODE_9758_length_1231_cov_3.703180_1_plen_55_part_10
MVSSIQHLRVQGGTTGAEAIVPRTCCPRGAAHAVPLRAGCGRAQACRFFSFCFFI